MLHAVTGVIAGIDKNIAGGLAAADAEHKFAHALQASHQRCIVAVAGNNAATVDQCILIGDFQGVNHQLDICVVLLADAVTQTRDHREGIAQQHFLQIVKLIRITVNFSQQDIPADLYFLQNALQSGDFGAAVLQINKNSKLTQKKTFSLSSHSSRPEQPDLLLYHALHGLTNNVSS